MYTIFLPILCDERDNPFCFSYSKKPEETFTKIKSCIGGDKFDQVAHVMNEMNPWKCLISRSLACQKHSNTLIKGISKIFLPS